MVNIIFSGKRTDNGEHIEGSSIISLKDGKVYLTNGVTPVYIDISSRGNLRSVFGGEYEEIFYEVDPESVGFIVGDESTKPYSTEPAGDIQDDN